MFHGRAPSIRLLKSDRQSVINRYLKCAIEINEPLNKDYEQSGKCYKFSVLRLVKYKNLLSVGNSTP